MDEKSRTRFPTMRADGTLEIGSFALPPSAFLDERSRGRLLEWSRWNEEVLKNVPGHWTDPKAIPAYRRFLDEHWYPEPISRSRALYEVRIEPEVIAGVQTEVFTPPHVTHRNARRVLVNLHGGGFTVGAPYGGQLESIPIAALGKIEVISVDYRMAPEHQFPAATEDVVAVYRRLLDEYSPASIGIYGCSAGALLTAQVIARLHADAIPLPGAVGMLCCAGSYWAQGDSAHLGTVLAGEPVKALHEFPYFRNADPTDPMVFPVHSNEVMTRFPPSLLVSATRDWVLSSVLQVHSRLISLNVQASLHVWEGLGHAFFYDPDLPESLEAHRVTVAFFDRHLGDG